MIRATMAVAAVVPSRAERAEFARRARWARLAALVLDGFFLSLVYAVVNSVFGVTVVTSGYVDAQGGFYSTSTTIPWQWLSLVGFVYFIVFEAMFGATPGKQLMRIKVVRLDGRPLGVGAVILRNVLRLIDFLPVAYVLGGVLVVFTPGAQRIGDLVAGTTVVYRHRAREEGATRTSSWQARRVLLMVLVAVAAFVVGFDYFGRPPLVVEGLYNQHALPERDATAYSLGTPAWGPWEVTYPIAYTAPTRTCTGTITLRYEGFGWNLGEAKTFCSS